MVPAPRSATAISPIACDARGRTYLRNGSVVDLQIEHGKIKALVAGSEVYTVTVSINTLEKAAWKRIKHDCSQSIDSLIDLLQGRFDEGIMQRLTERDAGLFPKPAEIKMQCSCPDWAGLCKHVAAVLYGVGARLDASPELLFTLRAVDHLELIGQAVTPENLDRTLAGQQTGALNGSNLGELFGIEIDAGETAPQNGVKADGRRKSATPKKAPARKRAAASAVRVEIPVDVSPKATAVRARAKSRKSTVKKSAVKKSTPKRRTPKAAPAVARRKKAP